MTIADTTVLLGLPTIPKSEAAADAQAVGRGTRDELDLRPAGRRSSHLIEDLEPLTAAMDVASPIKRQLYKMKVMIISGQQSEAITSWFPATTPRQQ